MDPQGAGDAHLGWQVPALNYFSYTLLFSSSFKWFSDRSKAKSKLMKCFLILPPTGICMLTLELEPCVHPKTSSRDPQHQMLLKQRMGTVCGRNVPPLPLGHMIPQRPGPHVWFLSPRARGPPWDVHWENNCTVCIAQLKHQCSGLTPWPLQIVPGKPFLHTYLIPSPNLNCF